MSDGDDDTLDHQNMAIELIDAFARHDATGLASLDPAGRAAQLQARQAFYDYVDQIWEGGKADGLDPAVRPEWNVVAGLRDLANALVEQASQAQAEAGDDD
jgi:hypothetical protein